MARVNHFLVSLAALPRVDIGGFWCSGFLWRMSGKIFVCGIEYKRCQCPYHIKELPAGFPSGDTFNGCANFYRVDGCRASCLECCETWWERRVFFGYESIPQPQSDEETFNYCTCQCGVKTPLVLKSSTDRLIPVD